MKLQSCNYPGPGIGGAHYPSVSFAHLTVLSYKDRASCNKVKIASKPTHAIQSLVCLKVPVIHYLNQPLPVLHQTTQLTWCLAVAYFFPMDIKTPWQHLFLLNSFATLPLAEKAKPFCQNHIPTPCTREALLSPPSYSINPAHLFSPLISPLDKYICPLPQGLESLNILA